MNNNNKEILGITGNSESEETKQMLKEKFSELLFKELFDDEVMKTLKRKMEKIKEGRFMLTNEKNKVEIFSNNLMWTVSVCSMILFCSIGLKFFGRIGLMAGCFFCFVFCGIVANKLHDYCVRRIRESDNSSKPIDTGFANLT